MYLWLCSPCWPIPFFSLFVHTESVELLGRGPSPSQSRYLHTEQHKYTINAYRYLFLELDPNPRPQCSSGRKQFIPQTMPSLWSSKGTPTARGVPKWSPMQTLLQAYENILLSTNLDLQHVFLNHLRTFVITKHPKRKPGNPQRNLKRTPETSMMRMWTTTTKSYLAL
jgi:hypothetical protein